MAPKSPLPPPRYGSPEVPIARITAGVVFSERADSSEVTSMAHAEVDTGHTIGCVSGDDNGGVPPTTSSTVRVYRRWA